MTSSPAVFVGLGSNVGDREKWLADARALLLARGFTLEAQSALYLTEPVGGPPQAWFLNQVVGGRTDLSPEQLMEACLGVERALGRQRTVRDGPRTIDVDLLLYGEEVRATGGLTLPHPRLHERRFVLEPLFEIAPDARHPGLRASVRELRARCADPSQVRRFQPAPAAR